MLREAPAAVACLVCGRPAGEPFADLLGVPANPNVLWPDPASARSAPRADLSLALCDGCGLIWNVRFDPAALTYGVEYENSLHFSAAFQRYSESLADRLATRYDLAGGLVAEIGSGKGEFLALLCERAGCHGIGFDPTYAGEADGRAEGRLTFARKLFEPGDALGPADFVVCRHVVEHLDDPVGLLAAIRSALGAREAALYVEVPSAEHLLAEEAVWDVIYTHVTCLSAGALAEILRRAGFHPGKHGFSFGGQYLWAEATTAPSAESGHDAVNGHVPELAAQFAAQLAAKREDWAERLPELVSDGRVVLWGAGAKATTFLNVVDGAEAIDAVVDLNPRKQGRYVTGAGQPIVAPESLASTPPTAVIVMNPVYRDEIEQRLRELGVAAEVLVA
jgi:SAM-dependent methyltransferase